MVSNGSATDLRSSYQNDIYEHVMMMKVCDFVNFIRLVHYNPLGGKMAF